METSEKNMFKKLLKLMSNLKFTINSLHSFSKIEEKIVSIFFCLFILIAFYLVSCLFAYHTNQICMFYIPK